MKEVDASDRKSAPSRPTVLFLDNSSTFGGAINSLQHLVDGLSDHSVQPIVLSGQPAQTLDEAFPDARTLSFDVRTPRRHPTALLRQMRQNPPRPNLLETAGLRLAAVDWHIRRTLPTSLQYLKVARRHDVDIVHLNNIVEGQLDGLVAAKLLGVPCVAHARGFQTPGHLLNFAIRHVDHHIAISNAIADNLEEIGAARNRISIVPDGIDVEEFSTPRDTSSVRRNLGIPAGAPAFGLFGRIMDWKGTREFVNASVRILRDFPAARALIVGDVSDGDASYFEEVRSIAESTDVSDRILFTGYRDDIPVLMQALDLVVHTSVEPEPFGMVIVEAMAAGTPVIASNRGGPCDIVREGETGYLVDPTDTARLVAVIEELLEEPDRAHALGRSGQERAETHFGSERYTDRILDVYSRVLNSRKEG